MKQPSKYQPIYDQLKPEIGRTFYIDFAPYRGFGKTLVKGAVRSWAKRNHVRAGIKITNPHLTGQQLLVSIKQCWCETP